MQSPLETNLAALWPTPDESDRAGAAISPSFDSYRSQTWEAMDTYFECITTCSIEDGECVTRCVEQLRSPA